MAGELWLELTIFHASSLIRVLEKTVKISLSFLYKK